MSVEKVTSLVSKLQVSKDTKEIENTVKEIKSILFEMQGNNNIAKLYDDFLTTVNYLQFDVERNISFHDISALNNCIIIAQIIEQHNKL